MNKRYRVLQLVITIYSLVGVVVILAGVLIGVFLMISPSISFEFVDGELQTTYGPNMVGPGVALLIGGLLAGVGFLAVAQLTRLMMDIEASTRATSEYMRRMASRPRNKE